METKAIIKDGAMKRFTQSMYTEEMREQEQFSDGGEKLTERWRGEKRGLLFS